MADVVLEFRLLLFRSWGAPRWRDARAGRPASPASRAGRGCRNAARAWPRRPRRTAAARQRGCTSRRWTCGLSGRRRGCCQYNTNRTRTGNEVTAAEGAGSGVPGRDVARLAFLLLPGLLLPSLLSCLVRPALVQRRDLAERRDRKSTRLNSSH